jgi:hypothetical protein
MMRRDLWLAVFRQLTQRKAGCHSNARRIIPHPSGNKREELQQEFCIGQDHNVSAGRS